MEFLGICPRRNFKNRSAFTYVMTKNQRDSFLVRTWCAFAVINRSTILCSQA